MNIAASQLQPDINENGHTNDFFHMYGHDSYIHVHGTESNLKGKNRYKDRYTPEILLTTITTTTTTNNNNKAWIGVS